MFIARSSLKRAFDRAGVDVASLTPEGVTKALSEVRQTLSVFLSPPETERHVAAIAALTRAGRAGSS
jgi:predicted nuclease with RNAse H fold